MLKRAGLRMRVGVNIGPNRDTPRERVAEDYAALMRTVGPLADFVVVNLSSPNTPGLREWQAPETDARDFRRCEIGRGRARPSSDPDQDRAGSRTADAGTNLR